MASNTPRLDLLERNSIINGNMDFWQRGNSGFNATVAADKKVADRFWFHTWNSSINITASRSTDVPTLAQSGFQSLYSFLLTSTAQTAQTVQISTTLEGQDYQPLHGRKVRLQFWVKSSVAGTYSVAFQNGFGGEGGPARSYVATYSIASANTWQKVTIDLQLDTQNSGWNFDNNPGLCVIWCVSSKGDGTGATGTTLNQWVSADARGFTGQVDWGNVAGTQTFQLTQVMLVAQDYVTAGSTTVDIPFQRAGRTIAHELQMCQRYYEKSYDIDVVPGSGVSGWYTNGNSNSGVLIPVSFKVAKCTSVSGGTSFRVYSTSGAIDNVRDQSSVNDKAVSYTGNGSRGGTTFYSILVPTATTGAYLELHWTADVEIL